MKRMLEALQCLKGRSFVLPDLLPDLILQGALLVCNYQLDRNYHLRSTMFSVELYVVL